MAQGVPQADPSISAPPVFFKGAKVPQSLSSILMCITHFLHQGEEKTSGLILLNIGGKEFMIKV